ncbi:fumarate hydratase [Parapedobacter sp. ISTM3]|uniref:fumarate hydratase n=1 Tax=Parapedobacter sp. ISTM3 TaxID=2800130 RepID=UPI0019088CCD|nr:fumarate hydratase [Parapedobacter sp. ISTM3]MBK1439349.1 fumarate hydratase [Parapedobacter sp. ISTM3]
MLFLSMSSCHFNPDVQSEGADYLQGLWIQDSVPMQHALLQYTLHELKFTCDSIYATLRTRSKVKNVADSCYNAGQWTEYAIGVYVVRGDSLLVDGLYTKPDWRRKTSGCHRTGQYLPRFKIVRYSADSLVLENRYDQRPILLRKIADMTCTPKKRWE